MKNADDGSVIGEAQGSENALDKFVQALNMGPGAAEVNKVQQKDIEVKEGEKGFDQ